MSGVAAARHPPGTSLAELVVVGWLFGLVLAGVAGFAAAQARLAATTRDRTRAGELARVADLVLGAELRALAPGDLAPGPDSIRLRALRGGGPVCGGAGGGMVRVRYRGVRRPDPHKDSVLLLYAGGRERAHRLEAVAATAACGEEAVAITLDPPPGEGAPALALVFETGAYWLHDGALRYRRGRGGRQPLTEELLETGLIEAETAGSIGLRLTLRPALFPALDTARHALRLRLTRLHPDPP